MPLQCGNCRSEEAGAVLRSTSATELFGDVRSPEGALSGLWLLFSCFEDSHKVSQDLDTPEGSYWHGILHRQEPDAFNAKYWFRRVGHHPIFPDLLEAVKQLPSADGHRLASADRWDPIAFVDACESARKQAGGVEERFAREVQRIEWELLFDYCARPAR